MKGKLSVRKPPETDKNTIDIEQFIAGDIQTLERPNASTSERRRTTIYFEPETFKRLKVYCAMEDVEMSETANKAIEHYLNALQS